jgi:hypothetical protein
MSRSVFTGAVGLAGALIFFLVSSQPTLAGDAAFKNGQFRFGASTHGIASAETGTADANIEWLMPALDLGSSVSSNGFSLHPQIGANLNLQGKTSAAFAGFAGVVTLPGGLFVEADLGGSVNNGYTSNPPAGSDRSELGCTALFREAFVIGLPLSDRLSVMATAEHMSNANLCQPNNGITNVGLKLGYSF